MELDSERQRNREITEVFSIQEKTLLENLEKMNQDIIDLRFENQKLEKYRPKEELDITYEVFLKKFKVFR